MLIEILKAVALGVLASMPIGPVAVLVTQKTIQHGRVAGWLTGMGAAVIDTTYAALSFVAMTFIERYLLTNQKLFLMVGGSLIVVVGAVLFYKSSFKLDNNPVMDESRSPKFSVQGLFCALCNPGDLVFVLGIAAVLKIDSHSAPIFFLVPAVLLAAFSYWYVFSGVVSKFRARITASSLGMVNRIAGVIVACFGVFLVVKGILM